MARFTLDRDIRFFEGISRELVDAVVTTAVVLYKLVIENSKTNLQAIKQQKTPRYSVFSGLPAFVGMTQ